MESHGIHYSVGLVMTKRHQNRTGLNLKKKKGRGGVSTNIDCARFRSLVSQNGF